MGLIPTKVGGGLGAAGSMPASMKDGRDHWYHELMQHAALTCAPEPMDAEDMLYILYTSGTTGKPKGVVHTTAGYLAGVSSTHRIIFDVKRTGIGILVSIYNSMTERQHEIAVMRALGAGRSTVMRIVLLESILLALGGGLLGFFVGQVMKASSGQASPQIVNNLLARKLE